MNSAKKPIITALSFLIILSTLFSTALADGIDNNSSALNASVSGTADTVPVKSSTDTAQAAAETASTPAVDASVLAASEKSADAVSAPSAESTPAIVLSAGEQVAAFALKFNGYKYVYGAASPSVGFDCSGFANYVYKQFGYALPRTAHLQYRTGTAVKKADLQPGDLVFFHTQGGHSVTHVGIYIGNNQFINASTTGKGVIICSLDNSYWSHAWVGAKRIIDNTVSIALA